LLRRLTGDLAIGDQHEQLLATPKQLLRGYAMLTFFASRIIARLPLGCECWQS
jgi:hypothetical protein